MEGCSKYCSFCVVPYTRGDEVSRPFDSVLDEVRRLAAQGVREITLLGQNVNAYAGPMADGALVDLATLIHHVAAVAGIERIRFTTSHPLEFTDSLIEAYASVPKLANHLHLPVQSGSDRILALMKRGYTALEFKEKVRKLRRGAAGHQYLIRLHRRFPGRERARLRSHARARARRGVRSVVQFPLQPASRYSGRGLAGRSGPRRSSRNGLPGCRLSSRHRPVRSAKGWSARCNVCWSSGAARKNAHELAGRTENNRWVNFAGPSKLIDHFVEVMVTEVRAHTVRGRLRSTLEATAPAYRVPVPAAASTFS